MAHIKIQQGFDIQLAGAPEPEITEAANVETVAVYPQEFQGVKPRLQVKEGDTVKKGSVLFVNKRNDRMKFRSPAGGTVRSIRLGERRALTEILIEVAPREEVEKFTRYSSTQIGNLSRDDAIGLLVDSGYLAYIRQRPFSKIADPGATPKSIFVNAMNTAPFQPDFDVVVQDDEPAFSAGLTLLTRLTEGPVHLCQAEDAEDLSARVPASDRLAFHRFGGPHPSGNASVHIHHIDPIRPGDVVWVVKAVDVIQIGKLLLNGEIPSRKVICLGGPGVREEARRYYRVRHNGSLTRLLENHLLDGEQRILSGDVLMGTPVHRDSCLRTFDSSLTVIPENRERYFLGWLSPGLNSYSHSRAFLSRWLRRSGEWVLDTNRNGSHRAMVLTGLYDRFLPMRIKVDFLVRAVLAHDTEEAAQLGILEVDPEDFALCSFACPSKMDIVGIIRKGLQEVEEEGF